VGTLGELGERLLRRVLFRGLFRGALTLPELFPVHHGGASEMALVGRSLDLEHRVGDAQAAPRELLLELGLVVDVGGDRILDPLAERVEDRLTDDFEAVLQVESAEGGLDECCDDVPVLREPLQLVGRDRALPVLEEALPEAQPPPDDGTALARDDMGADLCELALLVVREALEELLRDREPEDAVAQELEPLVRIAPLFGPGSVRERALERLGGECVDQRQEASVRRPLVGGATGAS
jgi:hypothetical protein